MVRYRAHSHQRGIGVSSSSMPSHSCPTVSVPVAASIFLPFGLSFAIGIVLENDIGRVVVVVAGARAEWPGDKDHESNHHRQQTPAVGDMPQRLIRGVVVHRPFSEARTSCAAALFTSTSVPSIWR